MTHTNIVPLQNTRFKEDYYSLVENMEQEDCKEACSTDANCVAALYSYYGYCYKLKFPLRRNIELEVEDDEIILTDWISKCYRAGELAKLFHGEEVEKKQFERVVMVGLWCIQSEPAFRPTMKNVILMIEGNIDVQVPPFPAS
ncbi:hypothetical protein AAC387_Pa06g1950 [Persea americana]